jgi:two-component system LytT family response regulator
MLNDLLHENITYMNVAIVDDELSVRNTIKKLRTGLFPDIKITSSEGTLETAFNAISGNPPDILFLDIELPDGNGFDLLKMIPDINFKVIFITGHQEYALDAIKVSAVDYILKPIQDDELLSAVEKAREAINHEDEQLKFLALSENLHNKKVLKRIILHTSDHLQLVSVNDIINAEADSNYTTFRIAGGKKIMVSRTMKEFDEMLSGSGFIRTHQSHLVNINYIDRFVKKDGGYLQLTDGTKIPVSPNLKKKVILSIRNYMYE